MTSQLQQLCHDEVLQKYKDPFIRRLCRECCAAWMQEWPGREGGCGWLEACALVASPEVDDGNGDSDEERAHDEDEQAERDRKREHGAQEAGVAARTHAREVRAELRADVEAGIDEEEHLRDGAQDAEVVNCMTGGGGVACCAAGI